MGKWSADRLAATSGAVFVVLFLIAFFTATSPPDSTDGNAEWVSYYLDHHRGALASGILIGIAVMTFAWFAGSLAAALRDAGERRLGLVAFGGGVATATTGLVLGGISAGLAYGIAVDSPSSVKAFVDVYLALGALISFPIALTIGASAIAGFRSGAFPRWWAWLSGAASISQKVARPLRRRKSMAVFVAMRESQCAAFCSSLSCSWCWRALMKASWVRSCASATLRTIR